MAILHQEPSARRQAGTQIAFSVDVPVDSQGVRIVFSREAWPAGEVATGEFAGIAFQLVGGDTVGRNGKIATRSSLSREWSGRAKRDGEGRHEVDARGHRIREAVPLASVSLRLDVKQQFRTALTVESF